MSDEDTSAYVRQLAQRSRLSGTRNRLNTPPRGQRTSSEEVSARLREAGQRQRAGWPQVATPQRPAAPAPVARTPSPSEQLSAAIRDAWQAKRAGQDSGEQQLPDQQP